MFGLPRITDRTRLARLEPLESRAMLAATPEFAAGVITGHYDSPTITEASGLVASRDQAGVLWTFNDNDDERLFALDASGHRLGTYTLGGIACDDWEDIAVGAGPERGRQYLYLADVGDNGENRAEVAVHRVAEPDVNLGQTPVSQTVGDVATFRLRFPDGPHDAETLIVDPATGDWYIITKRDTPSQIFVAPYPQSSAGVTTLVYRGQLTWTAAAAGDISPDGDEVLLKNLSKVYYYPRPAGVELASVLTATPIQLPYTPETLGEGISFDAAGNGYFTNSEGVGEAIFYYARLSPNVAGRHVFYNHSKFDGHSAGASVADDAAIASDKDALLPGRTASFLNYTSYSRGINGVMVDVLNPGGTITAADFSFRSGNNDSPQTWSTAPAPQAVTVRAGAGSGGAARVTLVWPNGTIHDTWLQVVVKATTATGLDAADVFYFGNAIAESGTGASAQVNASDELAARNNARSFDDPAEIDFAFDYNRDGLVNATDQILARSHATTLAGSLQLIVPAISTQGLMAASSPAAVDAALMSLVVDDAERASLRATTGGDRSPAAPVAFNYDTRSWFAVPNGNRPSNRRAVAVDDALVAVLERDALDSTVDLRVASFAA